MNDEKRRFHRTDRPGSGIYQGGSSPGVLFDDYRSADKHEIRHHREKTGLWKSLMHFLKFGPFPQESGELVKSAQAALARDPTLEMDGVRISAENGSLAVSGTVPTRWMKERITDHLLEMGGVSSIRNDLVVRPERNKLPQEGELTA